MKPPDFKPRTPRGHYTEEESHRATVFFGVGAVMVVIILLVAALVYFNQ